MPGHRSWVVVVPVLAQAQVHMSISGNANKSYHVVLLAVAREQGARYCLVLTRFPAGTVVLYVGTQAASQAPIEAKTEENCAPLS